ncbi:MAG TPA: hypothetical protein VGV93_06635 [Acidimicrobiales bacterium]|nr:hypothetical protein [Acidimicrobiales bacterium]
MTAPKEDLVRLDTNVSSPTGLMDLPLSRAEDLHDDLLRSDFLLDE